VVLGDVVTTFPELTDRLATDLGLTGDVLSPAFARIVVGSIASVRRPLLGARRGLVSELHGVIEELTASHLDAEDVRTVVRRMPEGEAALRLEEIGDVYAGYQAALARLGVTDRHGRTVAVADRLGEAALRGERPVCLAGVERIVFAEIYDYSVAQFLLATALIRLVGDAELVAFAHPENVEATRFLDRTWNRFVSAEPIAGDVLPTFVRRDGRSGAIATLLEGAFAGTRRIRGRPDDSVRLLVAPHRYGEAEATLRLVRERLRTGTPPDRIAVLARDMPLYREALSDVARRFGVRLDMRGGRATRVAGVVRFVLDLWRLAAEGLPRVSLGSVLDSDYVGGKPGAAAAVLARLGYVDDRIATVEACVQAAEARGRPIRLPARWLRAIRAIRSLDRRETVRGHVRAMRRTLATLRFRPVAREMEAPEMAGRDARAVSLLADALGDLVTVDRVLSLGPVGTQEIADLVDSILADLSGDHASSSSGGVRALSVQDARGLDFDSVFILGMDDGTFPRPRRESVLLPDWLRREVNAVAGGVVRDRLGRRAEGLPLGSLLRTAREGQLEEPFLFFLACSMATHELVLSRPIANASGTPCVPSPFLAEVAACFEEPLAETIIEAGESVPPVEHVAEPRELVARRCVERWRGDVALAAQLDAHVSATSDGARRLADIDRRIAVESGRIRYLLTPGDPGTARAEIADRTVGRLPQVPDTVRTDLLE